jgi:hypothetical protein
MVGPFLSEGLTQEKLLNASRFVQAVYKIPWSKDVVPEMSGIAARSAEQRSALDAALEQWLPRGQNARIRQLKPEELALIWFYIGWDVSEPVFAVEVGARTIVVDFDEDGKSLFWLEDITEPCFRVAWEGGGLEDCYCSTVEHRGNKYQVLFEKRPRATPSCCAGVMPERTETTPAAESDRPVIHNRVSAQTTEIDKLVLTTYGKNYRIVDVAEQDPDYVAPAPIEGRMPHRLTDEAGKPVHGDVLALYLIMRDGSARDPVVVKSTDERLNAAVVEALRRARFRPATWHGEPVATVAGQEVVFGEEGK